MIFRDTLGNLHDVTPSMFDTDKQYFQFLKSIHLRSDSDTIPNESSRVSQLIQNAGITSAHSE